MMEKTKAIRWAEAALIALLLLALILLALPALAGCSGIRELPREEVVKQNDSPEFAVGRELLLALLRNDASGFVGLLEPDVRERFTVASFRSARAKITRELGEPVSFRYLTRLEMNTFRPDVWAIRFKRENPKTGKTFYNEVLFQVVTGRADGKVHIISFQFK